MATPIDPNKLNANDRKYYDSLIDKDEQEGFLQAVLKNYDYA